MTGRWGTRSLVLFPVLAALGPYASITPSEASSAYLFRVLCLAALVPACVAIIRSRAHREPIAGACVVLALLWLCWAPVPLIWSPDREADAKVVVAISFALFGGVAVLALSRGAVAGAGALRTGWLCAFVATGAIAAWEMASGQHLESNPLLQHAQPEYIASTFFNPNDYASFLLACLAPLTWGLVAARSTPVRALHVLLLAGWCALMVTTESRTGILGAAVTVPFIVYWRRRASSRTARLPGPAVLCGTAAALALLAFSAPGRHLYDDVTAPFHEDVNTLQSDQKRVHLALLGWRIFLDSGLLGGGPGAFERAALGATQAMDLGHLTKAHNSFVELAAEFGLPMLAPLVAVIALAVIGAFRARRHDLVAPTVLHLRMSVLIGVLAFVAGGVAGSSTLASPWWWILLGSIAAQSWALHHLRPVQPDQPAATGRKLGSALRQTANRPRAGRAARSSEVVARLRGQ